MPRCNLTLRQKCQIIELHKDQSTDQIAKKFHVHPSTILRTVKKKSKILDQASRVNVNFKTVQTNLNSEEHDTMILEYIKSRQETNEPLSIKEICDKAAEFAKDLDRSLKSKRGWWRRFKIRCNVVKSRVLSKNSGPLIESSPRKDKNGKRKAVKKKQPEPLKGKKRNYTFKIKDGATGPKTNKASENEPKLDASPAKK